MADKKEDIKKTEDQEYYLDKEVFLDNFKKSYEFKTSQVRLSSEDQHAVESTQDKELVEYLKSNIEGEISEIPLEKGTLTVNQKEPGLYNAFYADESGQVTQEFYDKTVEMIAKNLTVKSIVKKPSEAMDREEGEMPKESRPMHLKLKFGDFEMELRKSVQNFVKEHKTLKKSKSSNASPLIKKSLHSWYKLLKSRQVVRNEFEAAKILAKNWEDYKEEFMQTVHAMQQIHDFVSKKKKR